MTRILRARAKELRSMPIPETLRLSMFEAHKLLREAEQNPDINLYFDDSIQVGAICGGYLGEGARPYAVTYFCPEHPERGEWELTLDREEIAAIADGRMKEIEMYCCTAPECHRKFREEEDTCDDCDYYEDDAEELSRWERLRAVSARARSKKEWLTEYLKIVPDPDGRLVFHYYNHIPGPGDRLGWFSFPEIAEIIREIRAESRG